MKKLKIGTRGSKLALVQTETVKSALIKCFPDLQIEVVVIRTKGDKILDKAIYEIGDKGLFINEFEEAILNKEIDIAIHSAKDLPTNLKKGLEIICTPKRADARDVLIFRKGLENISTVGTSSPRREFYIKQIFPHVEVKMIRGNIDTRLNKLSNKEYDAIILAKAGIDRLNFSKNELSEFNMKVFDFDSFLPAACQGILAIEARKDFEYIEEFQKINDEKTFLQYKLEREVLKQLSVNCSEINGIYSSFSDENIVELMIMYRGNKVKVSGEYSKIFEQIPKIASKIKS